MSSDAVALAQPLSRALHDALDACAPLARAIARAVERRAGARRRARDDARDFGLWTMKRGDAATRYARCARVRNFSTTADYACVLATTTPRREYFALRDAPGRGTHRAVASRARSGDAATTTEAEAVTIGVEFDSERCVEDGAHATWVVCVMAPERAVREAEATSRGERRRDGGRRRWRRSAWCWRRSRR